jgi:hypothetical protein
MQVVNNIRSGLHVMKMVLEKNAKQILSAWECRASMIQLCCS